MVQEFIEGVPAFIPYHENVIDISKPYQWLSMVVVDMSVLKVCHENIGKGWGYFGAHCRAAYLKIVFTVKVEVVHVECMLQHVDNCFIRERQVVAPMFAQYGFAGRNAFVVGYIGVK